MQPVFELSSSYKPSTLFSGELGLSNRYGLQTLTQICAVWVRTGCKGISARMMQVSYAIWHQALSEESKGVCSPSKAVDSVTWGSFVAAKMLRHPHPG